MAQPHNGSVVRDLALALFSSTSISTGILNVLQLSTSRQIIMNGMNGHPAAPPLWQEARNPEGRIYYYNTITKATQWTKPEDLMTSAEVGILKWPFNYL